MSINSSKILLFVILICSTVAQQFATFTSIKDITKDVIMKWKFEGDDVILYFEKKTQGHLWIGLGKTMSDADVWKITKTAGGGDLNVEDCYMNGYATPTCT
jgi:DOMON domain